MAWELRRLGAGTWLVIPAVSSLGQAAMLAGARVGGWGGEVWGARY